MRTPEEIVETFFEKRSPYLVHDNGLYYDMVRLAVREELEDIGSILVRFGIDPIDSPIAEAIREHFRKAGYLE